MLVDPCELSPSYVRSIAPYQPGKPISELAREMGMDEKSIVKLASNENPRGIGPRTRAAIDAALAEVARYPDGNGFELKQALAARYGVEMPSIVLGNGSNDVLELVAPAFLGPGRAAVVSQHPVAVYPPAAQAPRAPAVQRQQHRARRGERRARRHGIRRAQLCREPARYAPARGGRAQARPRLHSLARQLPRPPGGQGRGDFQAPPAARRDRASGGRGLPPSRTPAG